MIRPILIDPNPILREVMPAVPRLNGRVRRLIKDLTDTMYATQAAGMAANQIGVRARVCVIKYGKTFIAFVNPKITEASEETFQSIEGCKSLPDYWAVIPRSGQIEVESDFGSVAQNKKTVNLSTFYASVLQHELDHLDGVLIRDYVEEENGKSGGRKLEEDALAALRVWNPEELGDPRGNAGEALRAEG